MTLTKLLDEVKQRLADIPKYPHKKWPINFIEYPETNEMLDFGIQANYDLAKLIKIVEVQREVLASKHEAISALGIHAKDCKVCKAIAECDKIAGGEG